MDDDFNVFIVDFYALASIYFLYFLDDVVLGSLYAKNCQNVVGVDVAFEEAGACFDVLSVLYGNLLGHRNLFAFRFLVVGDSDDLDVGVVFSGGDGYGAGDAGNGGIALRFTCFEQFFDTRKTLCDIFCGSNAAGMECTHGELGARFADGLGGDDAYGFADFYMAAGGQVSAVALSAYAVGGAAGEDGADFQLVVVLFDFRCLVIGNFFVLLSDDFTGVRVHHIFQRAAAGDTVCQGFDGLSVFFDLADFHAFHLVHADFDERDVGGKDDFRIFRGDFTACRQDHIAIPVYCVFFQFLSCEVDGEVVAHGSIVFGYGVGGAQVEGLLLFRFFAFGGGDDDLDFFHQVMVEEGHIVGVQGLALDEEDAAVSSVNDVFVKDSAQEMGFQGHNAVLHFRLGGNDALFPVEVQYLYVAVFFADDDVLGNVYQTAGEVAGVCRTECGVGQTFTGAVGGGEVIEDG